jgi:hypothetical protein
VLRAAFGSVLYLALIALLSLGAATALREAAAAIGVVLGLLYLFPIIAAVAGRPDVERHLEQIGPMTAGLAIQATTSLNTLPISPLDRPRRARRLGRRRASARRTAAPPAGRISLQHRPQAG